jgi:hypothetical protein
MKPGRRFRPTASALVPFVTYASAKLALAQNGVGVGTPSDPSACDQLTKLRGDIAAQEMDMKHSADIALIHYQSLRSMCILWENYVREEEHMVEYAEEHAAVCGLSDDSIQQIRHHYNHSLRARWDLFASAAAAEKSVHLDGNEIRH